MYQSPSFSLRWIEKTDSDLKVHALHYANELLVRVRLSFQKLLQTRSTCRNLTFLSSSWCPSGVDKPYSKKSSCEKKRLVLYVVVGCSSKSGKHKGLKLFGIPKVISNQGEATVSQDATNKKLQSARE